jgi:hypothetical protein
MATKGVNPFEKSGKDVERKKFGKEGSKKEELFDKKQVMKMAKGGMTASSMGKVKTKPGNINGIAKKGLTKGTNIKMKKGGKC